MKLTTKIRLWSTRLIAAATRKAIVLVLGMWHRLRYLRLVAK